MFTDSSTLQQNGTAQPQRDYNTGNYFWTKHLDICPHFIRETVERKAFKIEYIDMKNQSANTLTKALEIKTLKFQCDQNY